MISQFDELMHVLDYQIIALNVGDRIGNEKVMSHLLLEHDLHLKISLKFLLMRSILLQDRVILVLFVVMQLWNVGVKIIKDNQVFHHD